jgi:hypothetical protein
VLTLASILILSSCGSSFDYDKDAAVQNAQHLIEKANSGDYQGIFDRMHETVQSLVSVETLRDSWDPILSSSGAFIAYEKTTTTGATQDGINYIVVIVPCEYEKNTLEYAFTFTEDYKIVSLELN